MTPQNRNRLIGAFVIAWIALFHYESLRADYLSRLAGRPLPKFKYLFPPAGWIMFFRVPESEGRAEVYGIRAGSDSPERIEDGRIFETRWIGYDNTRRNVLVTVLDPALAPDFCRYLRRKFPEYGQFAVAHAAYPSNRRYPGQRILRTTYRCAEAPA